MTWLVNIVLTVCMGVTASAQAIQGIDTGLGGTNSITGMVLAPSGQRMPRVSVRLSSMTKGDRIAVSDESGNFAFRGVPNGDYQVVVDKEEGLETFSQNVNVFQMRGAPGGNYLVSIRLRFKAGTGPKPGVINAELAGVPETAIALHKKAADLAARSDHKGAIEQLKLAIAEHPKFAAAYNDLGVQYLKLNDLARADDAFRSALNIDPALFSAMINHGIVLFTSKNYADAERVFRDVLKAKEGSATGHYFLGQSMAYQDKAKWPEAEKELTKAITLGGEAMAGQMKDAHYILGLIYGDKGEKKRQIVAWETYIKLAPDAPNAEQVRTALAKLKGSQ